MGTATTVGRPIFIVGTQRSGTTMLRLMLNAHRHIAIPFESDFIPKFYKRLDEYGDLHIAENVGRLLGDIAEQPFVKKSKLVRSRSAVLARQPCGYGALVTAIYDVYAESEGKRRWGDKDPDYVCEIDVLWKLFPGCQIIHIVRDGRGVANSLRKLEWGSKNLLKLARDWSWRVTLGHKMGMMIGARNFMEIRYEGLVCAPESSLRQICDFLGEPFDEQMLGYHQNAAAAMPETSLKFHTSSIRPPDTGKVDAWQSEMSLGDRLLFEEEAGHTLVEFGYACESGSISWRGKLRKLKYTLVDRW